MGWFFRKILFPISIILLEIVILCLWITQPLLITPKHEQSCQKADPIHLRHSVEFLVTKTPQRNFEQPDILEQAANFIEARFKQAGGLLRSDEFAVDNLRFHNVIARFGPPGEPVIVIGAHYDAESHTPGADDNASGVAGLLELARLLGEKPPSHTVELVAYTLEEPPNFDTENMGSWHHAAALKKAGISPKIVIVLEMIGYFDDRPSSQTYPVPGLGYLYPNQGNFIGIVSDLSSPLLVRKVKAAMRSCAEVGIYSINAPAWAPGIALSDHSSYWAHELPALMITDTAYFRNPHYHEASDLPNTLDYARMTQVVQGIAAVIREFDTQ